MKRLSFYPVSAREVNLRFSEFKAELLATRIWRSSLHLVSK